MSNLGPVNWTVSLVVGVILAILANLLTPLVQRGLDALSTARAVRSAAKREAEEARLRLLVNRPVELTLTLISSTLKAIVCYLLAAAFTSASNLPEQLIPQQYLSDFGSGVLGAIGTLLYLVALLLAIGMLKTVARVRSLSP